MTLCEKGSTLRIKCVSSIASGALSFAREQLCQNVALTPYRCIMASLQWYHLTSLDLCAFVGGDDDTANPEILFENLTFDIKSGKSTFAYCDQIKEL